MEFEVERQARVHPGSHAPEYPRELRNASVSGRVETTFIVNSTGRVDVTSFQVLASTDPRFTLAVQQALPAMQFDPAEINGRRVSELVRMPFSFNAVH
jgi:TonB family protein